MAEEDKIVTIAVEMAQEMSSLLCGGCSDCFPGGTGTLRDGVIAAQGQIAKLRAALKEALGGWEQWQRNAQHFAPPSFDRRELSLDRIAELRKEFGR